MFRTGYPSKVPLVAGDGDGALVQHLHSSWGHDSEHAVDDRTWGEVARTAMAPVDPGFLMGAAKPHMGQVVANEGQIVGVG